MTVRSAVARAAAGGALAGTAAYLGLVTGAVPLDLGIGRRTRPLGPIEVGISAPRELVFDVIAAPYAERTSRAIQDKVRVLERGSDMVLAAHFTPIRGRLRATTVETVRFTRPERVDFRLVRGPVPYVVESFALETRDGGTTLTYTGELGTDLWAVGQRWGDVVAARWEAVVRASLQTVASEAERRAVR
ncbi:MAG: hypothetical protein ACRDP9_26990 [Kribbellaceae bacterium]